MPKYIAKQSIGHFRPGDEIQGLEEKKLQALLASGAIEEYQELKEPKADGIAVRLAELEKENAELKAKVAELEKAKPAVKPKASDKPADETK
ncbi:hypothetical protein E0H88_03915 [Acinetobacter sp. ANC 4216]|uniref:hypothetical protein n=1 Tax=Acinetobacter sp. ANC 4216 TaxID=2529840 RepID=UPI00103B17A8|nr:hypothetical protein [Acinetobacter sp. ANC 4216]TCB71577.1 hypothetical protein E0H88_03915 [Acinetobacter sp. ANC 4216]